MIAFGFWLFAFFGWPGAAGFKFPRPSAKGRGGACPVLELARSPASGMGAGRHPPCPAGAAHGAAGGNFAGLGLEEANLVVREGVWVENADFGITLVHLRLVERSILVYGKWGQFGHLGGARRGMSFA